MQNRSQQARLEDRASWDLLGDELGGFTLENILEYGQSSDPGKIPHLMELYGHVAATMPTEERMRMLMCAAEAVGRGTASVNAFLPFIYAEGDVSVLSTATMEFAQLHPIRGGDVLTGPRELLEMASQGPDAPATLGLVAGLLLLGDRRLNPLLQGFWRLVANDEDRRRLAASWAGFIHAPMIDLLLDWLEGGEATESDWGAVLGSLARMPHDAQHNCVVEARRQFPAGASAQADQPQMWRFSEYAAKIWPRLDKLMQAEPEPKMIPIVMHSWGIQQSAVATHGPSGPK